MTTKSPAKRNTSGLNRKGRHEGSKNKATLFKEAMREGFENALENQAKKVFMATVHCAIGPPSTDKNGKPILDAEGNQMYLDGDSTAKKLILDRVIPVTKAGEGEKATGSEKVVINISGMEAKIEVMDSPNAEPLDVVDADFEEVE